MEGKTLIDAIGSEALKDRALGVAEFASQMEGYSRTLALVQAGLAMRIAELRVGGAFTGETAKRLENFEADLRSSQDSTNQISNWLAINCAALMDYASSYQEAKTDSKAVH